MNGVILNAMIEIMIMLLVAFGLGFLAGRIYQTVFAKDFKLLKQITNQLVKNRLRKKRNNQNNKEGYVEVTKKSEEIKKEVKKIEKPQVKIKKDNSLNNLPLDNIREKINPVELNTNGLERDDLKIIEGIGPKIEILLKNANIHTWDDLANSTQEELKEILKGGGERFAFHNPESWPEQAQLASDGKWEELDEFQTFLSGGKILKS